MRPSDPYKSGTRPRAAATHRPGRIQRVAAGVQAQVSRCQREQEKTAVEKRTSIERHFGQDTPSEGSSIGSAASAQRKEMSFVAASGAS